MAAFTVADDDQIMLATSTGQSIRCPVAGISRQGRASSGVKVFNLNDDELVVSVAYIHETDTQSETPDA